MTGSGSFLSGGPDGCTGPTFRVSSHILVSGTLPTGRTPSPYRSGRNLCSGSRPRPPRPVGGPLYFGSLPILHGTPRVTRSLVSRVVGSPGLRLLVLWTPHRGRTWSDLDSVNGTSGTSQSTLLRVTSRNLFGGRYTQHSPVGVP